ncbi:MAG: hypothetical protein IKA56_01735 [Clostridia bacterium]|nr:hypothetical protein [Clostridia bacterium]
MNYLFRSDDLKTKTFTVRQFENMVTTVTYSHPNITDGINLTDLKPTLLISSGDAVVIGSELEYTSNVDSMAAVWHISEKYTQKAGSFFIQLAFSDDEGEIKYYSEKLTMIVEPSVDYQRDFLEYNPSFMERFKADIIREITEKIPTKTSELENDAGYFSKERELAEYATNEYVDSLATQFETKSTPRQLLKFTAPVNSSKVVENVDVKFDSTGKMIESVFIALDKDGKPFALKDLTIYIKRTITMGKSVDVKFYANAANIDSEGILLMSCDFFMEQAKTVFGSFSSSKEHGRWKNQCLRQDKDNGEPHRMLFRNETVSLTDEALTSLKIVFTPASASTTNILTGTSFEVWGTDA